MTRLRWLTAGESHGPALVGILEGLPAGLWLTAQMIDHELARRQRGHGRGGRMKIERDRAELLGGVRHGRTLGSPLALLVRNLDFERWSERMSPAPGPVEGSPVLVPRPGHADLAGGLKYGHTDDLRNVLERASARETAMRVALGAAAKALLAELGIRIGSYVRTIGAEESEPLDADAERLAREDAAGLGARADASEVRALDDASGGRFVAAIDEARGRRETLGGELVVVATGMPVGLGSHVAADRRLDGRLGGALLSIPAMKAVELGDGVAGARRFGSQVHDPILATAGRLTRASNHAGGLEGGISNGAPLVLRLFMKPIATLPAALPSVHLHTFTEQRAHVERSDTCAVPAAGVIAEAVVALVLADAVLEALGGDTLGGLRTAFARLRLADRRAPGHLLIVGPPLVGKTTVGAALARRLGRPFVDLDAAIELRAGATIEAIFAERGEADFRAIEQLALREALEEAQPAVIALGGGACVNDEIWPALRRAGVVLGLEVAASSRLSRLAGSPPRPLLQPDPAARIAALDAARGRFYERADATLVADGLTPEEAAVSLQALLGALASPLCRP